MVRFKNRYFAIELIPRDVPGHVPFEIGKLTLFNEIVKQVQVLHGDFGVGAVSTGLVAKYCNPYTKIALIRCRHGPHRFVATALPLINEINGKRVVIRILYMGATINKCYKYIVVYLIKLRQFDTVEGFACSKNLPRFFLSSRGISRDLWKSTGTK